MASRAFSEGFERTFVRYMESFWEYPVAFLDVSMDFQGDSEGNFRGSQKNLGGPKKFRRFLIHFRTFQRVSEGSRGAT